MYHFQSLAIIVSLPFWQIVGGTTVTAFTSSLTGSLAAAQSSDCAEIASSCPFAQTACVSYWCNYACHDQGSCCKQANPQSCLVAANLQDPCFNIENSIILCTATADAECLCYDGAGNYNPSSFDNMVQSCSQLAVTASPSLLSLLTGSRGSLGYCTRFAGPNNSTASTSRGSGTTATSTLSPTPAPTGGMSSAPPTSTASASSKSGAISIPLPKPPLQCLILFWVLVMACGLT